MKPPTQLSGIVEWRLSNSYFFVTTKWLQFQRQTETIPLSNDSVRALFSQFDPKPLNQEIQAALDPVKCHWQSKQDFEMTGHMSSKSSRLVRLITTLSLISDDLWQNKRFAMLQSCSEIGWRFLRFLQIIEMLVGLWVDLS